LAFRHAPPGYDCDFCAFVRGKERPPWTLLEDVVWRDDEIMAWMNPRWWESNPGTSSSSRTHHLHVFPRHHGDGLNGASARMTTPAERRPYAARLRAALTERHG
jgi:hypothetical protein